MSIRLVPYPEYKDSGIPWLGECPVHWEFERAKWLFQKMNRAVYPGDGVVTCFRDGIVTLRKNRRTRGFTESLKEIGYQRVCRGDLVIHAMDAFAGAVGVSDSDGKCTPVYAVCRPRRDLNPHYYAYVVREMARAQWISALAKGIRERSTDFRFEGFAAQTVPIPLRYEQDRIAAFLSCLNRRINRFIHAKRRLIELLNEQKQAIIHRAVTHGLDPSVSLKASDIEWLRQIPEPWRIIRLKTLVTEAVAGPYGSSLTKSMYTSRGYRVYGQQQVIPDDFTCGDYYISAEKFEEMRRYQVFPGDVLISVMGTVGRAAVVPNDVEAGIINPRLVRYRPDFALIRPRFFQLAVGGSLCQIQLTLMAQGATMEGLNMRILGELRIPVPPLQEQDYILQYCTARTRPIDLLSKRVHKEIDHLREYRTRLIADIVTGKLDVCGVELHSLAEIETPVDIDKDVDEGSASAND